MTMTSNGFQDDISAKPWVRIVIDSAPNELLRLTKQGWLHRDTPPIETASDAADKSGDVPDETPPSAAGT